MSSRKPKPCTLGQRHKWTHLHNVVKTHINGRTAQISNRGVYECECGQQKVGPATARISSEES